MAKLVERDTVTADYDLPCDTMIVELKDGRRIYLTQGFGGMNSLDGGMCRWRHGIAIHVFPTDTLESLRADSDDYYVAPYTRMIQGYDDQRPLLDWDGAVVESVALSAK